MAIGIPTKSLGGKEMRIVHNLEQIELAAPTVLTVGAFDGLHIGHRDLLRRLVARAKELGHVSGVVTFDPLPKSVLSSNSTAVCLIDAADKASLLEEWGLELLVLVPFTMELARTPASEFVALLCTSLRMAELWIGRDFALGHKRSGDVHALRDLGGKLDFSIHVVDPVQEGQAVVSSTAIRQLILAGRVDEAAVMLGRFHSVKGTVVHGDARGRQLGFPTANLVPSASCALPDIGVYAVYLDIDDQRYPGVANVGRRPTFGPSDLRIEVHLIDFTGDLYGRATRLHWVQRLRAERRFENTDALREQITRDVQEARLVLQ